jgi:hypothetical protein
MWDSDGHEVPVCKYIRFVNLAFPPVRFFRFSLSVFLVPSRTSVFFDFQSDDVLSEKDSKHKKTFTELKKELACLGTLAHAVRF